MEEVLLIKVLWNKSLFYHLGRGGGKGEGKVIAFGLSQYIELINFLWSQLLTLSATTDPISVPFENHRNCKKILERVWLSRACLFEHNRAACASCLQFDGVIGPLKGQLTRHVVWTDRTRHVRALLSRISPSKVLFFVFMKTYNLYLVSFSNFVIVLINW